MRKSVRRRKSSISKAGSYSEIGKFWDEHELVEFWHKTRKIKVTRLNQTPIQAIPQKLQMNHHVNAIAGRLSLREPPQRPSLEILDRRF